MNFYIMSKDIAVAKWQDNSLEILNEKLLPLYFRYSHDVFMWIKNRAIDSKRPNSRLLKKALRMTAKDDISTVLSVNAATITDNYWIKPINSDLPERTPKKFQILKCNEYMVNNSDFIICYVQYSWGGAIKTLEYAQKKKHIKIFNLAQD